MKEHRSSEESLGNNIRKYREAKKLSLEKLARISNISSGFLEKIENGKTYPHLEIIDRLAQSLDVSVSDLWKGDKISEAFHELVDAFDVDEILKGLRKMSDRGNRFQKGKGYPDVDKDTFGKN